MRKLSIILAVFLVAGGFAFAGPEIEPGAEISGQASLTFGVDMAGEDVSTGFESSAVSDLTVTVVPEGSAVADGDPPVYGMIQIDGFTAGIADGEVSYSAGAVTASIVAQPVQVQIFQAPSLAGSNAASVVYRGEDDPLNQVEPAARDLVHETIWEDVVEAPARSSEWRRFGSEDAADDFIDGLADDEDWELNTDDHAAADQPREGGEDDPFADDEYADHWFVHVQQTDAAYAETREEQVDGWKEDLMTGYHGFTLSVPVDPVNISLQVASAGTWEQTGDALNAYSAGLIVDGEVVEGVALELGGFLGPFGQEVEEVDIAFTTGADIAFDPVTVSLGFDGDLADDEFNFDFAAGLGVDLGVASITADVYGFTEEEEFSDDLRTQAGLCLSGLDDPLTALVEFQTKNTLDADALEWNIFTNLAYDIDGIIPSAQFTFFDNYEGEEDERVDLSLGVDFEGFVANTTFDITWTGENLTAEDMDTNLLTFGTTISY